MSVVETDSDTNDGDKELADGHTSGTPQKDGAATKALHSPEGQGGGADVDEGEDERDQEGVADGTSGLQEGSRVVEDEVDTGPLLHHLEGSTENGLAQVGVGLKDGTAEAVGPRAEPSGRGNKLALVLLVGDDLSKLDLDVLGVLGLATKLGKGGGGIGESALLDEVSGGVGEQHETTTKDQSPGELNGDGDAVGASVGAVLGAVDDASSQEKTDGDAELVSGDESATNLLGRLWICVSGILWDSRGRKCENLQSQTCTE